MATGSDGLVLTQQKGKGKEMKKHDESSTSSVSRGRQSQHVTYITVLLSQIVLLIISQTKITDSMSFAILPLPHSSSHGAVSIVSLQPPTEINVKS